MRKLTAGWIAETAIAAGLSGLVLTLLLSSLLQGLLWFLLLLLFISDLCKYECLQTSYILTQCKGEWAEVFQRQREISEDGKGLKGDNRKENGKGRRAEVIKSLSAMGN